MGLADRVDASYRRRLLARRLLAIRKELGFTQQQVAHQMQSTQPVVSRIENGGDVRMSTLERYAAALGLALGFTVRRSELSGVQLAVGATDD